MIDEDAGVDVDAYFSSHLRMRLHTLAKTRSSLLKAL